ncbi:MAG: TatD family hydrolase [Patescibacteria group bacterium]
MALDLIDSHVHLDFGEYDGDQATVVSRAVSAGVKKMINVGCDADHFKSTLELADRYPGVFAAIGYHPHEAVGMMSDDMKSTEQAVQRAVEELAKYVPSKKLVAIGEIGLDYYRLAPAESQDQVTVKKVQKILLTKQIELAAVHNLPVIIHCREAYDGLFILLGTLPGWKPRGVIHCFEGTWAEAQKFLSIGFKISFTGNLTYERYSETVEAARRIPLSDIMIETDSPNLTPVPLRGQRNEPTYVEYVCRRLAELRGITPEEVAEQTTANAIEFFNLR